MSELGAKRREGGVLYRFFVVRKGFHICSFAFFYFILPLLFWAAARDRGVRIMGVIRYGIHVVYSFTLGIYVSLGCDLNHGFLPCTSPTL